MVLLLGLGAVPEQMVEEILLVLNLKLRNQYLRRIKIL
jgi:hypothetical protein